MIGPNEVQDVDSSKTLTDDDIAEAPMPTRRTALGLIGTLVFGSVAAAVTAAPRTAAATSDSDPNDAAGHGRTGRTDNDPNDGVGRGHGHAHGRRPSRSDSDPNDAAGHGRTGRTDNDPNDGVGRGR